MANLLLLYEITDKAARVTTKKAYKEFEKWIKAILAGPHDAGIQRVANTQLFRLKDQFAF